MSQSVINVGATANDGTGTALRTAWQDTNANFTDLYPLRTPYVFVDDYGAVGDGSTDDTAAIQAAENARTAQQILKGTPGKIYALAQTVAASLLTAVTAGMWDFFGCTLKYTGGSNLTTGGDGGGLGVVNILTSGLRFYGTIDCNSKARYGLALKSQIDGFRIDCEIDHCLEPALWMGIAYAASSDVTGTAISGRAKNVAGFLVRPQAPVITQASTQAASVIVDHIDVTAMVYGGTYNTGSATGFVDVCNDNLDTMRLRCDCVGIPQIPLSGIGNVNLQDIIIHDLGANQLEIYGTSVTNSAGFGLINSDLLGPLLKYGCGLVMAHANLGTDGSTPSAILITRGQGKAELDFDYTTGSGGRVIQKLQAPSETVLVSGVDAQTGNAFQTTLTADRVVGAPLNPRKGQRITYSIIQDGTGGHALTWNAVFKKTWSDTGNTASKRSSISFQYDGTNWNVDGAQAPYV